MLVGAVDSRRARLELAEIAILLEMPLIDLAVAAGSDQFVARAQVSWFAVNGIDPLDSWSLKDWSLIEQKQSCGKETMRDDSRPAVASASGMLAAAIGTAEIRKLLAGDWSSLGTEIRVDLNHTFARRSKLPEYGYSPLHGMSKIEQIQQSYRVRTLGDLVYRVNQHLGQGAKVMLNREISTFYCGQCEHFDHSPGPAGDDRNCAICGRHLIAAEPVAFLSQETLGTLANVSVGCLGVNRDLLRVTKNNGSKDVWIQYEERLDDE